MSTWLPRLVLFAVTAHFVLVPVAERVVPALAWCAFGGLLAALLGAGVLVAALGGLLARIGHRSAAAVKSQPAKS